MIADRIGGSAFAPVDVAQSGASVWRIAHARLYLKHGEGPAAALVSDEIARLRWLNGRIPSPRVIASVEVEGDAWLLTGELPGLIAGDYIKRDCVQVGVVAASIARFLLRLHALPVEDCPFDSSVAAWLPVARRLVAEGRVDTEDFDDEHAGWSAGDVLAKVEALAGHAAGRVVVHGDHSLGNIVVDDRGEVVGCLDLGRLGVGDLYRDIVIGWRDLAGFGEEGQRAFLAELGIGRLDEDRRELHRALDELL